MSYAEMLFEGASSKDLELAKKLIVETGLEDSDFFPWVASFYFNPNVKNPEMSIKTVIREALLKKMGFDSEKEEPYPVLGYRQMETRDASDHQIKVMDIDAMEDSQVILDLIGKPAYQAYNWDRIRVWKLGKMEELEAKKQGGGFIVLPETETVLFSDEIKGLASGKKLEAFHAAGIEGYLMETKVVFKVIDGELLKVAASFSD